MVSSKSLATMPECWKSVVNAVMGLLMMFSFIVGYARAMILENCCVLSKCRTPVGQAPTWTGSGDGRRIFLGFGRDFLDGVGGLLDAVAVAVEARLLRTDEQRQDERQHVQGRVRPAHAAVADGRQQDGGDAGAGKRGQTSRKVVGGQCRACLPSPAYSVMMVGSEEKAQVPMPMMIEAMIIITAFAPNHCGM